MSRTRALLLDFAAAPRRASGPGVLLCSLGLAAAIATAMDFERTAAERAHLEAAIETLSSRHRPALQDPARAKELAEVGKMSRELEIPWTRLLAELESASTDLSSKVSLLQVAPDADKHIVRITAEVRSLPDALAYLERLQQSKALRYPLLESHEHLKDDPEHAVRIKLAAEWRG
jgi:plasmid maintenance system killer protein